MDKKRNSQDREESSAAARPQKKREVHDDDGEKQDHGDGANGGHEGGWKGKPKQKVPQNHREQRDLRTQRKQSTNPGFVLLVDLKKGWEEGRQRTCTTENRRRIVTEMLEKIQGKVREIIFHHDGARIVQFCFQNGTPAQRTSIFTAVQPFLDELCQHSYSKFVVPKMLQYGDKGQRTAIITSFYGKVKRMMRHKVAAGVVSLAYMDYANAQQRASMVEEFYGPEFALFKSHEKRTLDDIFADQPTDKKASILRNMKEVLRPLLEKGRAAHHILHRLLLEYLTHSPAADQAEMIEGVREHAVEMLHTREGARVALVCLWNSDAKGRKAIIRTMKPFVVKISLEEYGHVVLLGLFDCVDDTVLVRKSITAAVIEGIDQIAADKHGAKVLLYLLCHRSSKHFGPDMLAVLRQGDTNPHSKKEPAARHAEVAEGVLDALHKAIEKNAGALLSNENPSVVLLVQEALGMAGDGLEGAARAVADVVAARPELMEKPAVHRVLKALAHSAFSDHLFARALAQAVEGQMINLASVNRSAFVLLSLMECGCEDVVAKVRGELLPVLDKLQGLEGVAGAALICKHLKGEAVAPRADHKRKNEEQHEGPGAGAAKKANGDKTPHKAARVAEPESTKAKAAPAFAAAAAAVVDTAAAMDEDDQDGEAEKEEDSTPAEPAAPIVVVAAAAAATPAKGGKGAASTPAKGGKATAPATPATGKKGAKGAAAAAAPPTTDGKKKKKAQEVEEEEQEDGDAATATAHTPAPSTPASRPAFISPPLSHRLRSARPAK